MQQLKITLLALVVTLFSGIGSVQAFSFDFGDDDDFYYNPYWRPYFRPWVPYYYPPQINTFDRSRMVQRRQELMQENVDAMTRLRELLYGKYDFDRAEAIKLARKIELTSGNALTENFHPGAVRDFDSRTTPAFWGNEQNFKANAEALKAAAGALANELGKQPKAEEGAVFLPKRGAGYGENQEKAAVSPDVWQKFNELSNTCESCHRSFRGRRWW